MERRARWRWFAGAALLAALVFGALTWIVLANNNAPTAVDLNVESFVVAHRTVWLTDAMKVLTWLGSSAVLVPLSLLVGGYFLLRRRDWRPLALLGVGLGVAIFWSSLVKGRNSMTSGTVSSIRRGSGRPTRTRFWRSARR